MKKFLCLLLLLFPLCSFAKTHLFVLFDAGETHALKPVIEDLIAHGETVDVLAFGTAQTLYPDTLTVKQIDRSWDRYAPLPDTELLGAYSPDVVIIGVASAIQLQIAKAFEGTATIVAYYDNFNPIDRSVYASLIREIEPHVDLFLTASDKGAASSYAKKTLTVGNPDVEKVIEALQDCDSDSQVIAYIGGYDTDYPEALELFAAVMRQFSGYHLVMCPHPKSDGSLEHHLFPNATFSQDSLAAIKQAGVVVCHRSTLGIKCLLAGKKVIFVDPAAHPMAEEWGAFLATDLLSFQRAMEGETQVVKGKVPMESVLLFRFLLTDEKGEQECEHQADR